MESGRNALRLSPWTMTSPLKNPRHLASAYCELGCVQDAVAYIHSLFWIYVPFSFLLAVFCLMFQCPDLCLVCLVFIFQILTHSHLLTAPLLHFHLCGLFCILSLFAGLTHKHIYPQEGPQAWGFFEGSDRNFLLWVVPSVPEKSCWSVWRVVTSQLLISWKVFTEYVLRHWVYCHCDIISD